MSQYHYSALSPGNNIRLLRLMPCADERSERTELHCELFEYSLQDLGGGSHLYEALSYTWDGDEKPYHVTIENTTEKQKQNLDITANLYLALLRLRDRSFGRIIWVDAICIDQENLDERGEQVKLMALIYSKAYRVLVWLGETTDDVKGALEGIQHAANKESTEQSEEEVSDESEEEVSEESEEEVSEESEEDVNERSEEKVNEHSREEEVNRKAILNLLKRPWFQRIWVLQEVAAARHVVMICGFTEIDGYAFCLGLKSLQGSQKLSNTASLELHGLPALTHLIERAGLRPKHTANSLEGYSLVIRPLAELVDMFHTRQASDPRDKVYALLGMSSDNPNTAGLQPDYNISWEELFQRLVKFILSENTSLETFSHRAVFEVKGYVLGQVSLVTMDGIQTVKIRFTAVAKNLSSETGWTFQASAKPIQDGDIICFLHGASNPTIIRQCKDHVAVIVIAAVATPSKWTHNPESLQSFHRRTQFLRDFRLVWDWKIRQGKSQDQQEYETLTMRCKQVLNTNFGVNLEETTRLWNAIMILDDLGEYEKADQRLPVAINSYVTAFKDYSSPTLNSESGRTLLSFAAGKGHKNIVELLLNRADLNLKDGKDCRTALWWAAGNGHEAVVRVLLETGKVEVDSMDRYRQTPLLQASKNGHEVVVNLLLKTGKVEPDSKHGGLTPLSRAAENGHKAVVELLLGTGKVDPDSRNRGPTPLWRAAKNGHKAVVELLLGTGGVEPDSYHSGQSPLSRAAENGHKAVVELLLGTGKVELDSYHFGQTPLSQAAKNGHKAVVELLLETGKVEPNSKRYDQTPLSQAAKNGHKAIVEILLGTGEVEADSRDTNDGRTPLSWAVENGHKAVVEILLETGEVEADSKDSNGRTPLSWAAENGHKAFVEILLGTGEVEADSRDTYDGRTPLSWAAGNGHKAVVELLLGTGKVEPDSNCSDRTPLSWAAGNGHKAVVELLLKTGKVEVDSRDIYSRTPLSWAAENGHEAIARVLLRTGKVEADLRDMYSQTPLSRAAENGHEAIVRVLLRTGKVEADSRDMYGRTPLSKAAENGHEAIARLLLKTGKVEVDSKDKNGQTPLGWAVMKKHEAVVKLLLMTSKMGAYTKR